MYACEWHRVGLFPIPNPRIPMRGFTQGLRQGLKRGPGKASGKA